MTDDILIFSRFVLNENGGGGCRRESQLAEALLPLEYRFFSSRDSDWIKNKVSKTEHRKLKWEEKISPYKNFWVNDYYRDAAFKIKAAATDWIKHIKENPRVKLVIMDDPLYFYPLVEYLYKKKIPVVGLCQNIESLSYSQLNRNYQLKLFNKEIKLLKKCALIITISREETFLLKNFNIPTHYLPYYPVTSIEDRMKQVRERRKGTPKEGFLMIGTAGNKVTRDGMKAFIDFWRNGKNKGKEEKLLVAGYGITKFLNVPEADNIDFLGEISNQLHDDILASVKAMVCFQEFGSGALTKIREMMIAGVPVLANSHAARSYHEYDGVVEFSDFDDLENAIARLEQLKISLPDQNRRPSNAKLLKQIKTLMD